MQNPTRIHEPSIPQFVQDLEALADEMHTRLDSHPNPREPHLTIPRHVLEFTTEWQMASTAEEV